MGALRALAARRRRHPSVAFLLQNADTYRRHPRTRHFYAELCSGGDDRGTSRPDAERIAAGVGSGQAVFDVCGSRVRMVGFFSPLRTRVDTVGGRRIDEQRVAEILKAADAGTPLDELLRRYQVSRATFFRWRARNSHASDLRHRLRELETENANLKRRCAELRSENSALKRTRRK